MARNLTSIPNITLPSSDYPNGRIKNAVPPDSGTPVIEELYGDLIQFFHKLMRLAGISHNGLPENETQGFQFLDAISYFIRTVEASTTQKGTVELATDIETQAGASSLLCVTPSGLESKTATESRKGIANIANSSDRSGTLENTKMVTVNGIHDIIRNNSNFTASQSLRGTTVYATDIEAANENINYKTLVPANLKEVKTFRQGITTVTSTTTYTIGDSYDVYIFTGASLPTVTMPTPVGRRNRVITLYSGFNYDGNILIANTGISGSQRFQFTPNESNGDEWFPGFPFGSGLKGIYFSFISDGQVWHILNRYYRAVACPFIYINGKYVDEILKNQIGIENNKEEIIDITQSIKYGENIIRLTEEKKEITYIDYLILIVDGLETILFIEPKILNQGYSEDFKVNIKSNYKSVLLKAKGYYTSI